MTITLLTEIITNPFFSVATLLLGYFIGNRLAIGRDRRKEFVESSKEFRMVFNQALVEINDENITFDFDSVRNGSLNKYEIAYRNFRHYVKGICRDKYDEAWENYSSHYKYQWEFDESSRKTVAKDIENLLKFPEYGLLKSMSFASQNILWKVRLKLFGPDKETKELIEKFSKHDDSLQK